ncbi:MAG: adenylate/guanylate cyclase domain-containing protein [Chloroflexota bacterium]|nr:adenylate/guanylate cyclase domain-containing protein [Chloroflexota bacterium]
MAILPQGTVTFLFSDIEGSTKLVRQLGPRYGQVLETHQRLLREAFRDGVEISTEGDSFFVAFDSATKALAAAVAGQEALARHQWPDELPIRVRMGLHTGQPSLGGDSYVGFDVHRAARIAAAGHGGQVLVSESTYALVSRDLSEGVTLRDMGQHRLKDLAVPERLFQMVVQDLPSDFPPLRSLDVARTNLPAQLTSFVGRDREMADLRALARAHRLVTVIGTGGTGKTRLMIQSAADLLEDYPDGVWLAELAPISDPELVAQVAARALGVLDEPGRSVVDSLVDFLRSKSLLLLLDNCEHVIDPAAGLVDRLVGSCPMVAILASSREALGVAGEVVFQVPSLTLPPPLEASDEQGKAGPWFDAISRAEAVRLFVDRASAVMPSFALTPGDAPAVVEICRRLDGIPLAIELAAARVTLLSPQEIALRLGDRFRLLTGGRRTALPRQQTLQALIDWSWQLLTPHEQRLLGRLSVFAGSWTLEAAAAVTRPSDEEAAGEVLDTLEGLGHLVDRSLVAVDRRGRTRYRLLETIRQYARDRLVAAGEVSAMRDAHLAFLLQLAERTEPQLRGAEQAAALAVLDADADNLRAALEWAFEADHEAALRLSMAMAYYWRSRSLSEGLERFRRAAELVHSLPVDTDPDPERLVLVARVLAEAATSSWLAGAGSAGRPWAEEAVQLARRTGDARALYEGLGSLAMSTIFSGEEDGVVEAAGEAIRLAESVGDWFNVGYAEAGLAQWEVERGNLAEGEAHLASATRAADRTRNPGVIAFTALSHARVSGFAGRLPEARGWVDKAIEAYREIGDHGLGGMVLVARSDLAHALRRGGLIDEAEAVYRETLHAWQHAGNRGAMANQFESFAFLAVAKQDAMRAARLFGAAEAIRDAAQAPMLPYERTEYDAAVATLREMADASSVDSAWSDGRRLTPDEAVALALS